MAMTRAVLAAWRAGTCVVGVLAPAFAAGAEPAGPPASAAPPPAPPVAPYTPPQRTPPRSADSDAATYDRCMNLAKTDPSAARDLAEHWQTRGGAHPADHCFFVAPRGGEDKKKEGGGAGQARPRPGT